MRASAASRPIAIRANTVEGIRTEGTSRPDAFRAGSRLPVHRAGERRGSQLNPTRQPKIAHPPLTLVDLRAETLTLNVGDRSRVLTRVNESGLRFSVFRGGGLWHVHPASDECFLVLKGVLLLDTKGGRTIRVGRHQFVTIPAGLVHRPRALVRTVTLCFKPLATPTRFLEDEGPRRDGAPTSRWTRNENRNRRTTRAGLNAAR